MLELKVRRYCLFKDFYFYKKILSNDLVAVNLLDNKKVKGRLFFKKGFYLKLVVLVRLEGKWHRVAFAHYTYGKVKNEYWMSGAITPQFLNSGLGIYAGVACLDYFFKENPNSILKAGVFLSNERAIKMNKAFGYSLFSEDSKSAFFIITRETFVNQFTNKIKDRILLYDQVEKGCP